MSAIEPAGVGGWDKAASVGREIRRARLEGSTEDGAREAGKAVADALLQSSG